MTQYYKGKAPDWFNLEKYEILKSLSSKSICEELTIRQIQLHYLNNLNRYKGHTDTVKVLHKIMKDQFELIRTHGSRKACIEADPTSDMCELDAINTTANILGFNLEFDFLHDKAPALKELTSIDVDDYFGVPQTIASLYEDLINEYEAGNIEHVNKYISDKYNTKEYIFKGFEENKVLPNINRLGKFTEPYKNMLSRLKGMFENTKFNDLLPRENSNISFLKVDLMSPDEQIHKELQSIIDKSRLDCEVKINEKVKSLRIENKKNGAMAEIKTLIEQRVLQYIDLSIWNKEKRQKATSDWYMDKIYQDKILQKITLQHSKMNDSIKPAAKKWLDKNWLKSFHSLDVLSYDEIKNNK